MWILSIGTMLRQFHFSNETQGLKLSHIFLPGPRSKQHGCRQLSTVALPLMMNIKLWTWSPPWNGCYPALTSELFVMNGCWSMLCPRSSIQFGSTKIVYFDRSTWCGSSSWVTEAAGRGPLALRSVLFWFLEIFPCESCLISIRRIFGCWGRASPILYLFALKSWHLLSVIFTKRGSVELDETLTNTLLSRYTILFHVTIWFGHHFFTACARFCGMWRPGSGPGVGCFPGSLGGAYLQLTRNAVKICFSRCLLDFWPGLTDLESRRLCLSSCSFSMFFWMPSCSIITSFCVSMHIRAAYCSSPCDFGVGACSANSRKAAPEVFHPAHAEPETWEPPPVWAPRSCGGSHVCEAEGRSTWDPGEACPMWTKSGAPARGVSLCRSFGLLCHVLVLGCMFCGLHRSRAVLLR